MERRKMDLGDTLAELQAARELAEQETNSLRREEREIGELRDLLLAALREAKGRSSHAASSAQRLEEAINRLVSPQWLSAAALLRACTQEAASLQLFVEQADAICDAAEAAVAAAHLRDIIATFARLRRITRAAADGNAETLSFLRQIHAMVAEM